jgi:hypothetical protein
VPVTTSHQAAALAAVVLLAASGCQQEEVAHFRVPKAAPGPAMPAGMPGAPPPGMAGDVPAPPRPESGLVWTLPAGWKDQRQGGMRYATLTPGGVTGKIDGSVVVLPGPAGGELPNVNRWRGQIGLPPIDEPALARARAVVKSKAGEVNVYDFTSEGQKKSRVIAGLLEAGGSTWFVKLTGDAEAVTAARAGFLQLVGSLRLE